MEGAHFMKKKEVKPQLEGLCILFTVLSLYDLLCQAIFFARINFVRLILIIWNIWVIWNALIRFH